MQKDINSFSVMFRSLFSRIDIPKNAFRINDKDKREIKLLLIYLIPNG